MKPYDSILIQTSEPVSEGMKNSFTLESNSIHIYSENDSDAQGADFLLWYTNEVRFQVDGHYIFIDNSVLVVCVKSCQAFKMAFWNVFFIANKCHRLCCCHPFV